MNANPQTSQGRLAELNPFANGVPEKAPCTAPSQRTAAWREGFIDTTVSKDEAYGCVDWYQYPHVSETNQARINY
jgi:hypothetical protein